MQKQTSQLARAGGAAAGGLTLAAIVRELRRPRRRRRWHGRILGVPYDFRRPTVRRVKRTWWAPRDSSVIKPRAFGLGWDVNLGRVWWLLRRRF
jgi:hypothetical protein